MAREASDSVVCNPVREEVGMAYAIVETIHGRYSKFEIYRESGGFLSSTTFIIYRDGKYWKGTYSTLKAAVQAIERS